MSETTPPTGGPTKEQLKQAFKAFKKRLKLTQLDEDSRLSRSPLSSDKFKILAISPPNQFPQEVWDELVKQGKLKKASHGTYEMMPE
jgi:parvulin-like peptidyl-prolyl isomerase